MIERACRFTVRVDLQCVNHTDTHTNTHIHIHITHTHSHTHTYTHTHARAHTYMKVLDLTEYSDHKPLSLELECKPMNINPSEPLSAIYQSAPFNVENKDKFQQSQSNESSRNMLQTLNITIDNIVSSDGDALDQSKITSTVIDTNNKFTEHLRDIAANCFKQTKNNNKNNI